LERLAVPVLIPFNFRDKSRNARGKVVGKSVFIAIITLGPRYGILRLLSALLPIVSGVAEAKFYMAYTSDSPASSVPYWVANDAGLLKKHGLDAELLFINGTSRSMQSLVAGDLSFAGGAGLAVITGKLAGGDIAIINSFANTLNYYVVARPEIRSAEELRGKTAATHVAGTTVDFVTRLALNKLNIPYKEIKAVTLGTSATRLAALISRQVDFTVVTDAGKGEAEKAGLRVLMDMAKEKIPFQFTCTVTTQKLIRENPELVRRMVRALAESVHYYKTRKEDVIKIMRKYTRGQSRDILEGAYAVYVELIVEDTYPTLEGLKNTLEVQAAFDPRAAKAKPEDFVDLRFVEELKRTRFIDQLYGRR
jgi:ABC-type nitrate/sulfonate/bicarbonate transport system substrate-binding protein